MRKPLYLLVLVTLSLVLSGCQTTQPPMSVRPYNLVGIYMLKNSQFPKGELIISSSGDFSFILNDPFSGAIFRYHGEWQLNGTRVDLYANTQELTDKFGTTSFQVIDNTTTRMRHLIPVDYLDRYYQRGLRPTPHLTRTTAIQ